MNHHNSYQSLSSAMRSTCVVVEDEAPCPDSVPRGSCKAADCLRCSLIKNLHKQCAKCLAGNWAVYENVDIQELRTGGLSNYLFLGALKDDVPATHGEPRKVLIRVYGEVFRTSVDSVVTDAVNFAILAEKRIGPGLHGLFPGGRIEEFMESRALQYSELSLPSVTQTIARHLARIHSLNMPMCKQPSSMFNLMEKFLGQLTGLQDPPRRPVPNMSVHSLFEFTQALSSEGLNGHSDDDVTFQTVQELSARFKLVQEYEWIK